MTAGEPVYEPPPAAPAASDGPPHVVVVGVASRDIDPADRRGWRLGGGVSYCALALARLGLRTGAVMGVDALASRAAELDLLRIAGVDLHLVALERGPVFENVETPRGRVQQSRSSSASVPPDAVPAAWRAARGWMLAPVAAELPDAWAGVPAPGSLVALGLQGLLRELPDGGPVRRHAPRTSPLLARADVVGVSRDDLDPALELRSLAAMLHPDATLIVTAGRQGGLALPGGPDAAGPVRHYGVVPSARVVDPVGAGDSFLAGVFAARLEPRLVGGRVGGGWDLRLGAVLASLVVEGPGLLGVPERPAVIGRLRRSLAGGPPADVD